MHAIQALRLAGAAAAVTFLAACGGDKSTGPKLGPPSVSLVNGVPLPTGLVGMTVLIQGNAFGDAGHGKVLFTPAAGGTAVQAAIADASADWTNTFIVTTVPQGVAADAMITVQTAEGVSKPVPFSLISNAPFSPSTITWTRTTDLPSSLQGLGAAFVPVRSGAASANYVFTVGGANATNVATTNVYRDRESVA